MSGQITMNLAVTNSCIMELLTDQRKNVLYKLIENRDMNMFSL